VVGFGNVELIAPLSCQMAETTSPPVVSPRCVCAAHPLFTFLYRRGSPPLKLPQGMDPVKSEWPAHAANPRRETGLLAFKAPMGGSDSGGAVGKGRGAVPVAFGSEKHLASAIRGFLDQPRPISARSSRTIPACPTGSRLPFPQPGTGVPRSIHPFGVRQMSLMPVRMFFVGGPYPVGPDPVPTSPVPNVPSRPLKMRTVLAGSGFFSWIVRLIGGPVRHIVVPPVPLGSVGHRLPFFCRNRGFPLALIAVRWPF